MINKYIFNIISQPFAKTFFLGIVLAIFKTFSIYLLLAGGTFLMLQGIVRYYPLNDHTGFLEFKQQYPSNIPWKIAFTFMCSPSHLH